MAAGFYFWYFYLDQWVIGAKHSWYLVWLHHTEEGGRCGFYFWQIAPLYHHLPLLSSPGIPGTTPGISHIGHKVSALHHLQLECGIAVSPPEHPSQDSDKWLEGRMTSDTEWTPGTRWAPQNQKDKSGLKKTKDLQETLHWRVRFFLA